VLRLSITDRRPNADPYAIKGLGKTTLPFLLVFDCALRQHLPSPRGAIYVLNSCMFGGKSSSSSLGVSVCFFLGVALFLDGVLSPSLPLRLRGVAGEAVPPPIMLVERRENGGAT
jgi:hypothetical protein